MLAFERRWALAILDSFAPSGEDELSPRPGEVNVLSAFDALRLGASQPAQIALRAAVWLISLSPVWLGMSLRWFSSLSRQDRVRVLDHLLAHPAFFVREATFLLKTVACLSLFEVEAVRRRSHYDGRLASEAGR